MATIKDVAKRAGVSVGTVSNMLNGRYSIDDEKYQRIKEAITELRYRPNYMARNLKYPSSRIIGILLPSLEEPYNDIYRGITNLLEMKAFVPALKLTQNNVVLEDRFLDQLIDIGAIGIIMVPANPKNAKKYQQVVSQGISLIALERKINESNISYILFDNKKQIYDITKSLLSRYQPENLCLYIGNREFSSEKECAEGFLEAMSTSTGKIVEIKEIHREAMFNAIYQSLIELDPLPEAIIASSQQIAFLINEVNNLLNRQIPIHALVGENWYTTNIFQNITLYGRKAILMGKTAAQKMEMLLDNRYLAESQTIYLEPKQAYELPHIHILSPNAQTLRVLAFQCDAVSALKKMAYSFERSSGIRVEFDELKYRSLKETLIHGFQQESSEYDICMIDLPWLSSVLRKQYLADLTDWVKKDHLWERYPDTVRNGFGRYDRGFHIFPIIATTQVILYRQDIFEDQDVKTQFMKRYGFELTYPKSWTNFNVIAEFFDRRYNPYSRFEHGTAATALEPVGLINEFLPRQWSFHGSIVDAWGKICIDSEENIRALENLVTTFRYTPKEAENFFWDEIFELLVKGEIPMAHGFASHYQPNNFSGMDTYENYIRGIALPYNKAMMGGWALGINKNSTHIPESYEYLKWNLNDRIAVANMRLCGCTPVWAVFQDETLKGTFDWLNMVGPKVELGSLREELFSASGNLVDSQIVDEVLSAGIRKAIHQELDAPSALKEVKENLKKILIK